MTQNLFLLFLAFLLAAIMVFALRYLQRSTAWRLLAGLVLWLTYVGCLSCLGVIRKTALRPPGIAYVLLPVIVFLLLGVVRSAPALRVAVAIPLGLLIGFQSYRIVVELLLHMLWIDGLVPRMLTYHGANFDILIGLSAPLAGWLSQRGRRGLQVAFAWNVVGLFALTNIAIRSLLTAPGPFNLIHTEVSNLAFGIFPFTFIPGFLAPLAAALHVLALRAIQARLRSPDREPSKT